LQKTGRLILAKNQLEEKGRVMKDEKKIIIEEKENNIITRRHFVVRTGAAAAFAAGTLVAGPALAEAPVIEFIETSCGKDNKPKILVGYSSMCGSTGGIAQAIGKKICAAGASVDVKLLTNVDDLTPYSGFVIGSPIIVGQWQPEASRFLKNNKTTLEKFPVAYFLSCMMMVDVTDRRKKLIEGYMKQIVGKAKKIIPVGQGMFAGSIEMAKVPKKFRPLMKTIGAEDEDYREWDKINAWAEEIAPKMVG
jgi:menaquinone-dependent protoporphyrinogen oxidase